FFLVFLLLTPCPPISTLFPYTTLFRSIGLEPLGATQVARLESGNAAAHLAEQQLFGVSGEAGAGGVVRHAGAGPLIEVNRIPLRDRKSTRLNSSHVAISYAVFCLKKKK